MTKPYYSYPQLSPEDKSWCTNCGGGDYTGRCTVAGGYLWDNWTYKEGDCLHCGAANPFVSPRPTNNVIVGGTIKYLQGQTAKPEIPSSRPLIADDGASIRAHAERLGLKL